MKKPLLTSGLLASIFLAGCVTMGPVSNSFESARTLDKGQIEIMGNYSQNHINIEKMLEEGERESYKTNNNFGFRLGYGIMDRLDVKLRYERLLPVTDMDKELVKGVNYFELTPRYSIWEDRFTGGVRFGLYSIGFNQSELLPEDEENIKFAISPVLAYTQPFHEYVDVTLTTRFDFFTEEDSPTLWHVNLGLGLSTDLSKWMLRPEFGVIMDVKDFSKYHYFTGGIGVVVKFNVLK